jgi:alpha-ribazole phosphatase
MRPIFVRHAPPLVTGFCAGRADIDVEEVAPAADAVVRALRERDHRVARVFSSPTARCRDLAVEVASRLEAPVVFDTRLMELNFGEWEGRTWDEIVQSDRARFDRWARDYHGEAPPGGERVAELEGRVAEWLAEMGRSDPALSCLAVTHAGVIRAVRVLSECTDWKRVMEDPVPYLEPLRLFG